MRSIVKAVSLNKYYDQYHALKDINTAARLHT